MFKHHINGNSFDRAKGGLFNDSTVWRFVCVGVFGWQSHDYGHTALSNVKNIGTKVLCTNKK